MDNKRSASLDRQETQSGRTSDKTQRMGDGGVPGAKEKACRFLKKP